jgi:hypothetical protein
VATITDKTQPEKTNFHSLEYVLCGGPHGCSVSAVVLPCLNISLSDCCEGDQNFAQSSLGYTETKAARQEGWKKHLKLTLLTCKWRHVFVASGMEVSCVILLRRLGCQIPAGISDRQGLGRAEKERKKENPSLCIPGGAPILTLRERLKC